MGGKKCTGKNNLIYLSVCKTVLKAVGRCEKWYIKKTRQMKARNKGIIDSRKRK